MAKITLFGMAGTGKGTTATMLCKTLGYEYMSTGNIFREYAKELGMTLLEFEEASKHTDVHDRKLDQNTTEYGQTHDNFIFESRLAWHFIPDSFKIALICDFETRVERVAHRENKSFSQAKEETIEREALIKKRYKDYYGISDLENTSHFDLVVDTTHNPPEKVCEIILNSLKKDKII